MPSNAVYVNGYQVGSVSELEAGNKNLTAILVTIKLSKDYNIPDNSVASINTNPLGSPSIEIALGNSTKYLKSEDTLKSAATTGLMGDITNKLGPVADQVTGTLHTLDSVLTNLNTVLDPRTKGNLQQVIGNLVHATAGLIYSTSYLQKMLNPETGALAKSLNNVNSFTQTLASNNEKLSNTMSNIETATKNLSEADIDGVINNLKTSAGKLDSAMAMLNSTEGSLGAMINDKQLYKNLNSTIYSMNILADDLRAHPKRYVNISVFGRKNKGDFLTAPLQNDSTNTTQE
jgi:phospholipid/cholesterol/gamma-HCH transport system substrate-binding protein